MTEAQVLTEPVSARRSVRGRRPRHVIRWIAGLVLVALVSLAVVAATRPAVEATPFQSPLQGHKAPGFSGVALGGATVSLATYRGQFVVVTFFASWCPPCQQEMPDLVKFDFQQGRHPHGAQLISVVFQDPNAAARQFAQNWGAQWPFVADPGGVLALDYGVSSPPTTFLIDPSGVVVQAFTGPLTEAQLDGALVRAQAAER